MARNQWRDGFFTTSDGSKPAEEWLEQLPTKPAAEVIAVVKAVRDAPPPAFAGGGKWEAMHGDMLLDGASKPNRTAMPESVYRRVRERRNAYRANRSVDFS